MKIWAFDPGSVATGLAVLHDTGYWWAAQYGDPVRVIEQWEEHESLEWHKEDMYCVVEDYRSAGHLTNHAKQTIKVLGYLQYSLNSYGYTAILRVEQQRLSGNREADELMKARGIKNPESPEWKDARSALAHCITYMREIKAREASQG